MKRWLSAMMAVSMLSSAWSAHAADTTVTQDAQLQSITKSVKQQLSIPDTYTSFYGEKNDDGLEPSWQLHWSAAGDTLDVTVRETGIITNYQHIRDGDRWGSEGSFEPKLPANDRSTLENAAQRFLKQVLSARETVQFQAGTPEILPINTRENGCYGTLYYDGLPTPTSISVQMRNADLSVISYTRNESKRIGDIPTKTPVIQKADAVQKLKSTLSLRLQYTTQQSKPNQAVLRYMPENTDRYYVDAESGKIVNFSELERKLTDSVANATSESAAKADGGQTLTDAEKQGSALLKDVLDKNALDNKLRAMPELGLSGFTMNQAVYSVNPESTQVQAYLSYSQGGTREHRVYKNAVVDAKTGELLSFSTYRTQESQNTAYRGSAGRSKAQAFLQRYQAKALAQSAEATESTASDTEYVWEQQVNGYPFPENRLSVAISPADGTIDGFSKIWNDDIVFEDATKLVSNAQALDQYWNAHKLQLGYTAVPVALDPSNPVYAKYLEYGYRYLTQWRLTYTAELNRYCYGIDAKTGNAVFADETGSSALTYTDVDMTKYPQAATLAQFGIGYAEGVLQPERPLTQEALIALLLSADGYIYDPTDADGQEALYEAAYQRGILTRQEAAPQQIVTRAQLIKLLITCTGYGKTAGLPGIYRCSFVDESSIPVAYYGYIATAQGMGLIRGDEKGRFLANAAATREQAILVLYQFMSRK